MLTGQNKKFVQEYVATGDQTTSYETAYPTSKTWKSRNEATKAARKLLLKPEVKAYYDELIGKFEELAILSRIEHMDKLAELRDIAVENGNYSAAVAAEKNRGLCAGLYVERRETTNINTRFVINADAIDENENPEEWAARMAPN